MKCLTHQLNWKKHFIQKRNESCSSGKSAHSSISPVFLAAGTPVNLEMDSDEARVQEM